MVSSEKGNRASEILVDLDETVDVKAESFMAVSDIQHEQMRLLIKRNRIMHVVLSMIACGLISGYFYFYYYACINVDYYTSTAEHNNVDYFHDIYNPLIQMVTGVYFCLSVFFFSVGCLMLVRLKRHFKDFYKHFGCKLWIANVLLTFPLLFRGVFDALKKNTSWTKFWFGSENYYRLSLYNVILITLATYLPMIM